MLLGENHWVVTQREAAFKAFFFFTHCSVACLAALKGVGDSRESIVCEILHCTYQDPLPTPPPPPQCACPQLLQGFNIVFTTCAFPIKHHVPSPLPALQRKKLYSLCFNFSWVLQASYVTTKCSKLKWNHELQASCFTAKFWTLIRHSVSVQQLQQVENVDSFQSTSRWSLLEKSRARKWTNSHRP